ncbi:GIN domain-containing protein [Rhodospirillaceae bacterium SYSU D60014]|uniref:GIN domain-containing protein n=1 Tax=Virgifigura deserti TaxID=2268457 RepID=UPI0013C45478
MIGPLPGLAHGVIERSGKVIVEPRNIENGEVGDVDCVRLAGIGTLILEQGEGVSLAVEAEDNILPHVKMAVSDGVLTLSIETGEAYAIHPTKPILYRLKLEDVEGLELTGAGSIQAQDIHMALHPSLRPLPASAASPEQALSKRIPRRSSERTGLAVVDDWDLGLIAAADGSGWPTGSRV